MVAKKTAPAAKKSTAKKTTAKQAAKKAPVRKAAAGRSTAPEERAAKKQAAKKVTKKAAKKTTKKATKKTAGKKTAATAEAAGAAVPAGKSPRAKKAAARKAPAAGTEPARKTAARAAAPARKPAKKAAAKKTSARTSPGKKTGAKTVVAKKTQVVETSVAEAAGGTAAPAEPGELAVRPGEDPWTPEEIEEARQGLLDEVASLRSEIRASEEAVSGLMRDSGGGAGDDQADTGTKNISREHEMALAAGARERLVQTERALVRLEDGTYGRCESCGKPIGKARMQAFPRATLCVECKQRQERR
ncbi:hypothetical protein AA958_06485 [Streptomyces sp. CNQ-509]|nr:TraR/DksA family transcriptional regulator [Streptomyces sp. CNQ-509]AKH81914.1 hypothetical protein AA958_06485 [Streptomyces sp. CNQ-509]